jgi:hypothetical protein
MTDITVHLKDPGLRKAVHLGGHLGVTRLGGSHDVYLVSNGHNRFILKSFLDRDAAFERSRKHLNKEYGRLEQADRLVNHTAWVRVVRPIYKNDGAGFFAEQYVPGKPLSRYMKEAMKCGNAGPLYEKLTMLAGFLSLLHKSTATDSHVNPTHMGRELKKHARQASIGGAYTPEELNHMERTIDEACGSHILANVKKALAHGDANPSNFLYRHGRLYVIDMERSGYKDPVYDLGMVAGELFHYAMQYLGDPYRADPFIGHFYWMYAGNHEDQLGTFIRLTKRNPLYMANSLLRIARHPYFSREYKRRLAYHARDCLLSMKWLFR